jgi:hypothetical protein
MAPNSEARSNRGELGRSRSQVKNSMIPRISFSRVNGERDPSVEVGFLRRVKDRTVGLLENIRAESGIPCLPDLARQTGSLSQGKAPIDSGEVLGREAWLMPQGIAVQGLVL